MASKKLYEALAKAIRTQVDKQNLVITRLRESKSIALAHDVELGLEGMECIVNEIAIVLKSDNSRFDHDRFMKACGLVKE